MRMPSIYIHPNSDDEGAAWEGFLLFWSTINDKNNYINPGPHLQVNTTYDVQLDITQSRWKLTINGEVVHDGDKEQHELVQTVPCYASNPFSAVADVQISDILITTTAVDMSIEPTIEVTSPPTPFPTAVSPQSVTNEIEENTSTIRYVMIHLNFVRFHLISFLIQGYVPKFEHFFNYRCGYLHCGNLSLMYRIDMLST